MAEGFWQCPQCGLFNVAAASRCDCGYTLGGRVIARPRLSPHTWQVLRGAGAVVGFLFLVVRFAPRPETPLALYAGAALAAAVAILVIAVGPRSIRGRAAAIAIGLYIVGTLGALTMPQAGRMVAYSWFIVLPFLTAATCGVMIVLTALERLLRRKR